MLSQAQSTTAAPRALEELFERLYVQYHRPLFSYVLRLVGHWEQAEDLTQETFVKAYHALARLPADSNYRAWLYRIATNTCYDALRRRRGAGGADGVGPTPGRSTHLPGTLHL